MQLQEKAQQQVDSIKLAINNVAGTLLVNNTNTTSTITKQSLCYSKSDKQEKV
jgi:hypothetical protein